MDQPKSASWDGSASVPALGHFPTCRDHPSNNAYAISPFEVPILKEDAMHAVNVSGLKNNPSEALRNARDDVVVMNRDQPDAVMIGLQSGKLLSEPGVRAALATALFRDGGLSLRFLNALATPSF